MPGTIGTNRIGPKSVSDKVPSSLRETLRRRCSRPLWPIGKIIQQHHERLDGSGYPNGISGSDILEESLIIGFADTAIAMTSHRPFRPARSEAEALKDLEAIGQALFGETVSVAALSVLRELWLQDQIQR